MAIQRFQGKWVLITGFSLIWLVLIFFASLILNREEGREHFFLGFALYRFILTGLVPVSIIFGVSLLMESKKNKTVSSENDQKFNNF